MLLANFNRKEHLRHRAVSSRQHGFLVSFFTGFVSSDECDGPWMPTPLRRSCVLSSRRSVQWSTPVGLRNGHFTTRPEFGGSPSHRHSLVRPRSVKADSRPTTLAQRSRTRGIQAGWHCQSVTGEQSTKVHVSGQLLHSGRRRRQST